MGLALFLPPDGIPEGYKSLLSVYDTTFEKGYVAYYTDNAKAAFTNYDITALDSVWNATKTIMGTTNVIEMVEGDSLVSLEGVGLTEGIVTFQADTLQGKINELQNQQASIQAQIDLSEAEKAQLEQQIADAEVKIKAQAAALGETLKTQYYSNQTSALDILMNSDSVSDYVDRQTRQQSMSDQITETVNEIKQAKADLESKKAEVEELISRQNAQKQDLADSQAEQQALLNQTQGQEDKYRELTDANNAKIEQLRKEQAEEIARRLQPANGATCGGGYPAYLCNAAQDSLVDPWGMYNRECVSYAAFKVASTYGWPNYWTRGGNNANQWPGKADRYGIPRGSTPKVGSVAVMMSGYYGHVAWVEEVHGNRIVVSDYNSDMRGNYARYETSASAFDTYIYFDQS